jgi:AcrR family transcriptional regulator
MGRLIDPERRKRAARQREERKAKILRVARSTFSRLPFVEVTMDSIGQAADVDRGLTSMYFRSKEELFLLLLREELAEWYSALETQLEVEDERLSDSEIAALLAKSLSQRPKLTRFLSYEAVVLEQNLEAMEVFRYQRWRLDRMTAVGELFEQLSESLGEGEGLRLLHRVQLLTAALCPAAEPKGAASYEVGDPDFEAFRIDFEAELETLVKAILRAGVRG